jgi:hypothetical protein
VIPANLKDVSTTIAVIPFAVVGVLVFYHSVSVEQALALLSGLGAYIAMVSNSKGGAK